MAPETDGPATGAEASVRTGAAVKVFISSLIAGLEPIRAAARAAVVGLGHEVVMAEDFGARPTSPQVACLEGVRQAGIVVLILGKDYGARQPSGLSATHEEYREARQSRPVVAFVQEGVDRDADEAAFVREVQEWVGGLFRGGFTSPEDLQAKIGRAIHEVMLSRAAGPVDEGNLLERALGMLPEDRRGSVSMGRHLTVAIASGPTQAVLRPSRIEDRTLAEELSQAAMFGPLRIFDRRKGVAEAVEDGALVIRQERETSFTLTPQADLLFALPIPRGDDMMGGVIEEDVADLLGQTFRYAASVLDRVDPTQRVTHVVPVAAIGDAQMLAWRTRAETDRGRGGGMSYGIGRGEPGPVRLTPALRTRSALVHDAADLIEDFVTLLRRAYRSNAN
ncbi:MAG: hypothetical protein COT28_12865 [Methylobacterium sp. CG08_land_8_20_14_0_20_71_15]|uniref:DUF4062 domain-containing protein n=1 Tax=Methylobacterium jeotgali TaxID=381630 RepID=A0ABQ4SS83_9HYPH|nr:MAG: hypothetical protein COT56_14775 [Methylobacterium sp. CG09_land_8_20_14_0_10_71_15]PIU12970.1 MAG: hypothetical protein COT28_12865 [Methylobacterium sp. CG08_land_8_20_14_0_20_71_15]GBU15894.1 hypothetical protein AwMethylo_01090 [Methylobacterium sp.]GJE05350.1 hypothetical protein AOPFMNJM_0648 [Methylobacterium jeotgali]